MCEKIRSPPVCVNDGIRDLPLNQEKHNEENPNGNNVINNQLTEVRKSKHEQFLKSHFSMKSPHDDKSLIKKAIIIGNSMLNGVNDDHVSNVNISSCVKCFSGAKIRDIDAKIENLLTDLNMFC